MNPRPPYPVFPPPPLPPPFPIPPPRPPYFATPSGSSPGPITTSSSSPDLPTALSSLTSLLHLTQTTLTQTTLTSLSSLLPIIPSLKSPPLARCPFNPNHLIPPSSLLSHHLSCPSSSTPIDPNPLLSTLHYPNTLHSPPSTQPLENPTSSELCFSLENFLNFSENFFYINCPGPVVINPFKNDSSFSHPMLTLPGILSAECANFTPTNRVMDDKGLNVDSMRLLPSEIWAVRCEVNGWDDYPSWYSCRVLRLLLPSRMDNLSCLEEWIIVNSPKYGVVVDSALRDHVVLLFKLSLKAIVRESVDLIKLFIQDPENRYGKKFECPNLVEVMSWFGCQLSILYGKVNGKSFAVNMLKQCVLDSAPNSSIFPMVEKDMGSSIELDGPAGKSGEDERKMTVDDVILADSSIYVSQVASAVGALYERCWLELKIKALQNPQPLSAYQRKIEHERISRRAIDERQQRSDYRPVIEHDGFLWQQSNSQEANRIKTREELLAEERDYKRRRMSYRGKKMKRSTTQVTRDIIDEYMEEIKKVRGLSNGPDEVEPKASGSYGLRDAYLSTASPDKKKPAHVVNRGQQHDYGEELHYHSHRSLGPKENVREDSVGHTGDSRKLQVNLENERSVKRARYDKDYSRCPHLRSDSHLQGHTGSRWKHNDPEMSRETLARSLDRSHSKSYRQKSHQKNENESHLEIRNRQSRRGDQDLYSNSLLDEFEDRYNPLEVNDGGEYYA